MVVLENKHGSLAETGVMPQVGEMWLYDHVDAFFRAKRVYVLLEYKGWVHNDIVFKAFCLNSQRMTNVYFNTETNPQWKLLA